MEESVGDCLVCVHYQNDRDVDERDEVEEEDDDHDTTFFPAWHDAAWRDMALCVVGCVCLLGVDHGAAAAAAAAAAGGGGGVGGLVVWLLTRR